MAQPMTALLIEPTYVDIPVELFDADEATCTAGYGWCAGDCDTDDAYHCGTLAFLPMLRFTTGGWVEADDVSLLLRHDENEGDGSQSLIMLDGSITLSNGMTAKHARTFAAWLLNAADLIDPLPTGAMATTADKVRIGDDLRTEDGWQKVTGVMFFADTDQASIFTTQRDPDTDGWGLSFNDPVMVRRPIHGSCAIQFVQPLAGGIR